MYLKQQRERAHIQSFVDRFRAKATKAKQAQSRIKALERMQDIAAAHIDSPFEFSFTRPKQIPNPLLTLDKVEAGYGSTCILEAMSFTVQPGTRVALIGPNGAGKSTLIRTLSGEQEPLTGVRTNADGLRMGYFAQHNLEQIDPQASAVQLLTRIDPKIREQDARNFLGGFDFHGDQATEPCEGFSGGEKARLVLALLIWQRPNLLLLDEPTNHLDLEMRHALTMALQDYEGALIVVSHDRHLLRSVTDELWLVADGKVENYTGDLDEYSRWLQRYRIEQQRAQGKASRSAEKPVEQVTEVAQATKPTEKKPEKLSATDRKALRQQQAEARLKLQPLTKELKQLDKKLEKLSKQQTELDTILADETLYEDAQRDVLKQTLAEQTVLKKELEHVESRWVELGEQIEALELASS
jgi:ATP-binding cassette subfamily F protein 3